MTGEVLSHGRPVHFHSDHLPPIPMRQGGHFEHGAVARCSCGKRFVSKVRRNRYYGNEMAEWVPLWITDLAWWRRDAP